MKRLLDHPALLLGIRVLLGGMFIIASLDKIVDPGAFAASILNYKLISATPALIVATVLPWVELLAGLGMLLGLYPRGSALLIALMLAAFTIMVGTAMARGLDIACGCFSQDPSVGRIGLQKILENLGSLVLAAIALRSRAEISLSGWLRR
jgi:putative oxidoreductase